MSYTQSDQTFVPRS